MATSKKRINVTIDDETYTVLKGLSEGRGQSISSVSLSLIEHALEFQEDRHFSHVADERLAKKEKRISHRKAWE
jgi:predicted DNA-binding protein